MSRKVDSSSPETSRMMTKDTSSMTEIERQLEVARRRLLDLTMRNRLLNYRATKRRTIRIVDEIPREIYNIVVLEEKPMEFLSKEKAPVPLEEEDQPEESDDSLSGLTQEESARLWGMPASGQEVATRHLDKFLQTALDSEALQKKLFYMHKESQSILEEAGYSVLYLAVGFLEWAESQVSADSRKAPLILIPVELERTGVGTAFKLRWTGEEVSTNISLQEILSQQGVALPDFEMPEAKEDIDTYFQSVSEAIAGKRDWRVLPDLCVGFFSFTKFFMYRDLDPKAWPEGMSPADAPLIGSIFDPTYEREEPFDLDSEEIDDRLRASELYHVVDADPSQIVAIEEVKAGRNVVVEGPPGTGKSQTITNVIAESLAAGKTVLFVSEKMAALEVVKDRLDAVGMGDFCLELHSRKSTKKQVLEELGRTMNLRPPKPVNFDDKFDELELLKSELNGYARALRQPLARLGWSPFDLICRYETSRRHFEGQGRPMPQVSFPSPEECDQKQWAEGRSALRQLEAALPMVVPVTSHPWRGCKPGPVLPSDEQSIRELLDRCKSYLDQMQALATQMSEASGTKRPQSLEEIGDAIEAASLIARSRPIAEHVLENHQWAQADNGSEVLVQEVEAIGSHVSRLKSKFKVQALGEAEAIVADLNRYAEISKGFLKVFSGDYRRLNRRIEGLYIRRARRKREETIDDLRGFAAYRSMLRELRSKDELGVALWGGVLAVGRKRPGDAP